MKNIKKKKKQISKWQVFCTNVVSKLMLLKESLITVGL